MPDWRDADAYPGPDQLTLREWWWEFTRRRPDYREEWERAQVAAGHDHRLARDLDNFSLRFELSLVHDPARSLTDWSLMHYRISRNHARSPVVPVLENYGHPHAEAAFAMVSRRQHMAEDAGHMLYNFDLSQPLGEQLKRAEVYLRAVQLELFGVVPTRRPRRGNWREFLRALDGRDCDATFAEIAAGLWPGLWLKGSKTEQSARDTHVAACRLRDNFPI